MQGEVNAGGVKLWGGSFHAAGDVSPGCPADLDQAGSDSPVDRGSTMQQIQAVGVRLPLPILRTVTSDSLADDLRIIDELSGSHISLAALGSLDAEPDSVSAAPGDISAAGRAAASGSETPEPVLILDLFEPPARRGATPALKYELYARGATPRGDGDGDGDDAWSEPSQRGPAPRPPAGAGSGTDLHAGLRSKLRAQSATWNSEPAPRGGPGGPAVPEPALAESVDGPTRSPRPPRLPAGTAGAAAPPRRPTTASALSAMYGPSSVLSGRRPPAARARARVATDAARRTAERDAALAGPRAVAKPCTPRAPPARAPGSARGRSPRRSPPPAPNTARADLLSMRAPVPEAGAVGPRARGFAPNARHSGLQWTRARPATAAAAAAPQQRAPALPSTAPPSPPAQPARQRPPFGSTAAQHAAGAHATPRGSDTGLFAAATAAAPAAPRALLPDAQATRGAALPGVVSSRRLTHTNVTRQRQLKVVCPSPPPAWGFGRRHSRGVSD
jgi:hypothetical protein